MLSRHAGSATSSAGAGESVGGVVVDVGRAQRVRFEAPLIRFVLCRPHGLVMITSWWLGKIRVLGEEKW